MRVDVRGLASLYSAHASPWDVARAGLLDGADHDLATLGAIFAGPAPWMPDMF